MAAVLDDITVVDLSPMMPGHFCTMILADLGARVVTVERPGVGHFSRSTIPGSFEAVNRNKESLTLDLKQPAAQAVLHRLVERCDVVVEGFRPGVVARLGADYETLSGLRPQLVYCSISGFGQEGPNRDLPGHDPNYLAIAGVLGLAGDPDGPPEVSVGASMADLSGAWFAAISILAALRARDRLGVGQHLDVALADTSYALVQSRMTEYLMNGRPPKSYMMSRPGVGGFEASDGRWLTVGAVEDHFWTVLCRLVGLKAWGEDPRFATNRQRRDHGAEIRAGLGTAFRARPRNEWIRLLEQAGVPCAPVNSLGEAAEDPQAVGRGLIREVAHPALGKVPLISFPVRLPATPATIRSAPPLLGQHTDAILEELGVDEAERTEMRATHAI